MSAYLFILVIPLVEGLSHVFDGLIGRDAPMKLMECSFTKGNDEFSRRQRERSCECIQIEQSASRKVEALLHATELCPQLASHEQCVRFGDGQKPASDRRFI